MSNIYYVWLYDYMTINFWQVALAVLRVILTFATYVLVHFAKWFKLDYPDSKVHGANMGTIWDRQDPGGPHDDPMNFDIWVVVVSKFDRV